MHVAIQKVFFYSVVLQLTTNIKETFACIIDLHSFVKAKTEIWSVYVYLLSESKWHQITTPNTIN